MARAKTRAAEQRRQERDLERSAQNELDLAEREDRPPKKPVEKLPLFLHPHQES